MDFYISFKIPLLVSHTRKKFSDSQRHTQTAHVSKASESIVAVLNVIAPGDGGALWEATKTSKMVEKALSIPEVDSTEYVYLQALNETYQNADGWDTRRQILSIMADVVPLPKLEKYIPGINEGRVKAAKDHKDKYGRGAPVVKEISPRMRVDPIQLDHFLSFIASPHLVQDLPFGEPHLKLPDGKIIETPNVIRTMVKQRTITQYLQFCEESNFKPFSPSTMHRILTSCSASVRKSLQGLDYISAEGTSAFDDLSGIIDSLIEHNLDPLQGQKAQKALKEAKQYLKTGRIS